MGRPANPPPRRGGKSNSQNQNYRTQNKVNTNNRRGEQGIGKKSEAGSAPGKWTSKFPTKKTTTKPNSEREKAILGSYKRFLHKEQRRLGTDGTGNALASQKPRFSVSQPQSLPNESDEFPDPEFTATTAPKEKQNKKQPSTKPSAFKKAKLEYSRKNSAAEKKRIEKIKEQEEREARAKQRKETKLERQKAWSQKTRKGQPKMGPRIQLLLNQIQEKM